jgi:hypothetical protein
MIYVVGLRRKSSAMSRKQIVSITTTASLMIARVRPADEYPGPVAVFQLNDDDEAEWKRWKPQVGNLVIIDLPDLGKWPGKVRD